MQKPPSENEIAVMRAIMRGFKAAMVAAANRFSAMPFGSSPDEVRIVACIVALTEAAAEIACASGQTETFLKAVATTTGAELNIMQPTIETMQTQGKA